MFNFGDFIRASFVRALCVRVSARFAPFIKFVFNLLFTPGAVWGALGGRRPLLGGPGDTPQVRTCSSVFGLFIGFLPSLWEGLGEGRTGVLLDLPVWTDTSNVVSYLGGSGVLGGVAGPWYPICLNCGFPSNRCVCSPV